MLPAIRNRLPSPPSSVSAGMSRRAIAMAPMSAMMSTSEAISNGAPKSRNSLTPSSRNGTVDATGLPQIWSTSATAMMPASAMPTMNANGFCAPSETMGSSVALVSMRPNSSSTVTPPP